MLKPAALTLTVALTLVAVAATFFFLVPALSTTNPFVVILYVAIGALFPVPVHLVASHFERR